MNTKKTYLALPFVLVHLLQDLRLNDIDESLFSLLCNLQTSSHFTLLILRLQWCQHPVHRYERQETGTS